MRDNSYKPILGNGSRDLTRIVKQTQSLNPAAANWERVQRGGDNGPRVPGGKRGGDFYRTRFRTVRRTNRIINFLTKPANRPSHDSNLESCPASAHWELRLTVAHTLSKKSFRQSCGPQAFGEPFEAVYEREVPAPELEWYGDD